MSDYDSVDWRNLFDVFPFGQSFPITSGNHRGSVESDGYDGLLEKFATVSEGTDESNWQPQLQIFIAKRKALRLSAQIAAWARLTTQNREMFVKKRSSAITSAYTESHSTEIADSRRQEESVCQAAASGGLAGAYASAEQLGIDAAAVDAEVRAFAAYLRIDPVKEADLLWIAFEAAAAPLLHHWRELHTPDGAPYYHCVRSGRTQVTYWGIGEGGSAMAVRAIFF